MIQQSRLSKGKTRPHLWIAREKDRYGFHTYFHLSHFFYSSEKAANTILARLKSSWALMFPIPKFDLSNKAMNTTSNQEASTAQPSTKANVNNHHFQTAQSDPLIPELEALLPELLPDATEYDIFEYNMRREFLCDWQSYMEVTHIPDMLDSVPSHLTREGCQAAFWTAYL